MKKYLLIFPIIFLSLLGFSQTLPVTASSFLVGRIGNGVSLSWKTEIEMMVLNFEVERSYDNLSFHTIGTVAGAVTGSSTTIRHKLFRQSNGFSYSDIKTVKGLADKAELMIYPNPSVGNARITISDVSEPTRIEVIDNAGRLIKNLMLNNTNSVELNGLLKGAFTVRIIGSVTGSSEVRKLTVIN